MRESVYIGDVNHSYHFIGQERSKQMRKGGGVAVMWRKDVNIECEMVNIGDSDMSEDFLAVKLEHMGKTGIKKLCILAIATRQWRV